MIAFLCLVIAVHDGDGPYLCQTGERVRLAGVQSPDFRNTDPCRKHRAGYTCDDAAATRARDIVARLVMGRTLVCEPLGLSYRRIVARCSIDGRDLSCAVIAAGGGVRWDSFWRRYRLPECGR